MNRSDFSLTPLSSEATSGVGEISVPITSALSSAQAAEVLPWSRPTIKAFARDVEPLLGRYVGRLRRRRVVMEVSRCGSAIALSANGSPARAVKRVEGWIFRLRNTFITFKRAGDSGPASEMRFDAGSESYILKRR